MSDPEQTRRDAIRVLALIATMPEPSRTVFLLHRIDAQPLDSIARQLGATRRVVEYHLANAMLHLDTTPHPTSEA